MKKTPFTWGESITAAKSTESFNGCKIQGTMATEGYGPKEFNHAKRWAQENEVEVEEYHLRDLTGVDRDGEFMVLRGAGFKLVDMDALVTEHQEKVFPGCDRKVFMFGELRNRKCRYNGEIGPKYVASDLLQKQGVIFSWDDLPVTKQWLHVGCPKVFGPKAAHLLAEINYYYDILKCGIGFHGDSERPDVLCLVVGGSKIMHFQGFRKAMPEGNRLAVRVHHGDMYVMDINACGHLWGKERGNGKVVHYRHAAGPLKGSRQFTPTNEQITKKVLGKRKKTRIVK